MIPWDVSITGLVNDRILWFSRSMLSNILLGMSISHPHLVSRCFQLAGCDDLNAFRQYNERQSFVAFQARIL